MLILACRMWKELLFSSPDESIPPHLNRVKTSLYLRVFCVALMFSLEAVPSSAQPPTTLARALLERLPPVQDAPGDSGSPKPLPATGETPLPGGPSAGDTPLETPVEESPTGEPNSLEDIETKPEKTTAAWYSPLTDWFLVTEDAEGKKIWQRSVELGIDGSEGNSNTFNIRFGADLKRQTELTKFRLDLDYYKAASNDRETANQTFLDCRSERRLRNSRLNWFLNGNIEHDEFKVYDLRLTLNTGTGYRLVEKDRSTLTFRFGAGASHEIGGPEPVWISELVYGIELEHQVNKRQKIGFTCDYFPDVTDFRRYRFDGKASWEVLLDEGSNLSLKLSIHDRYDATAYEIRKNDLAYSAVLLWKF